MFRAACGIVSVWIALLCCGCNKSKTQPPITTIQTTDTLVVKKYESLHVKREVIIANYFEFMDSLVIAQDSLKPYPITEHILVHANPWIIDSLANTDYYRQKTKDSFIYNQRQMVVIPAKTKLVLPDSAMVAKIIGDFKRSFLDINIPEFKLRIFRDSTVLYEFPVRVGRYERKYLKMSDRIEDLRTKHGTGSIVGYNKNPRYVNPCNNREYYATRRDDDSLTKLPRIPFIETQINGLRNGQMIHPTTNPKTLGKAYSNGCIGTSEAAAWIIYYHAPIDTPIEIRYDLSAIDEKGDTLTFKDVYGLKRQSI